jgi:hypothetical protein
MELTTYNKFTITYYLVECSKNHSDDESSCDDEKNSTELTSELSEILKNFVNNTDVKFWEQLSFKNDPIRNAILCALQNCTSYFSNEDSFIIEAKMPKNITNDDINNEHEGIFCGWYDSNPMIIQTLNKKYHVCTKIKLHLL